LQERESKDILLILALANSTEACSAERKVLSKIKKNNVPKTLQAVKRSSMSVEKCYKVTNLSLHGIIVRENRLRFEIVFLL
jgi:hypothetical protein